MRQNYIQIRRRNTDSSLFISFKRTFFSTFYVLYTCIIEYNLICKMVTTDTGVPDPDNPNEDLKVSNETIIGVSEDDSDQEIETETFQMEYQQYQPLPTCPNEELDTNSDDEENEVNDLNETTNVDSPGIPVPPITPVESTLVKEVWSGPSPEVCDIKMDSQKVHEVKQAMLNITLPESAIPDWATNIPEEEWKLQLMKRLKK